jgi:hypothetical protein
MSTGVKIGIGLGATLGVVGIVALIFAIIMLRRRGQKKPDSSPATTSLPVFESGGKPMSAFEHGGPQEYHNPVYELHDNYQPHELPHDEARSPVELGNQGR